MTDASVPSPGTPREVLAGLGELTHNVRVAQRGAWIPLLLFGLLDAGGILADRLSVRVRSVPCAAPADGAGGAGCTAVHHGAPVYWTVGLIAAYALTAALAVRRARRRGVGTPIMPYVLTGLVLVALVAATSFWAVRNGLPTTGGTVDFWGYHLDADAASTHFLEHLTGSAAAVGIPLLVLAAIERSRALLAFAAAYLVLELAPAATDWASVGGTSPWSAAPRLAIPAVFLLLGSLGFARADRRTDRLRGTS